MTYNGCFNNGHGIIRQDDKTDHGGVVVSASGNLVLGKRAACVGDIVQCPKCKGTFPIEEGAQNRRYNGKPIAFHGHKTACGASLISTWGMKGSGGASGSGGAAIAADSAVAVNNATHLFDEMVHLDHEMSKGVPYYIEKFDGTTYSGRTDQEGQLPRIFTDTSQDYKVFWGDEALAKTNKES